jgi:hypothetical protein
MGIIENGTYKQVAGNVPLQTTYSTEETKTGATWIDGKPVYRKVIQSAMPVVDVDGTPVTLSIPHGVSDMGHVINITGTAVGQDSGKEYYSIGINVAWPVGSTQHYIYVQRAGDHLNIVSTRTVMNDWNIFIILEYTKTTDA